MHEDYDEPEFDARRVLAGEPDEPEELFTAYAPKTQSPSIQVRLYSSGPADKTGRRGRLILDIANPSSEVIRAITTATRGDYRKAGGNVLIYHGLDLLPAAGIAADDDDLAVPEPESTIPAAHQGLRAWFDQEHARYKAEIDALIARRDHTEEMCRHAVEEARAAAAAEIKEIRESTQDEISTLRVALAQAREKTAADLAHEHAMQQEIMAREIEFGGHATDLQRALLEEAQRAKLMREAIHMPKEGDGLADSVVKVLGNENFQQLAASGFAVLEKLFIKKS